ncbi:hypothetical protein SLS62_000900 [Diatrype stigma]|uniref:Uncharacterized protein n=1 Tax=Diatrype stigma TaxID=117547 RepID=A0AAN9V992_9PEZI
MEPSYYQAHGGSSAASAGNPPPMPTTAMQMPPMPFSTPDPTLRSVPAPAALTIVPPAARGMPSPPHPPRDPSPTEAFIPIMHRRAPSPPPPVVIPPPMSNSAHNNPKIAIPPIPASPDSDDDGFTPVTPASAGGIGNSSSNNLRSPRSGGGAGLRAFDALGIPVVVAAINRGILGRVRSRKVTIVDPSKEDYRDGDGDDDTEFEDVSPLTPTARDRDVEKGGVGAVGNGKDRKTMRRTLAGIIEGWWDLGLLERGKSLKRKG